MSETPIACTCHDHRHCVNSALEGADALCALKGVRLTALRRRVLELVWQSHKPLGAYDILATLSAEDGRRAAPPTVYRALEFLLENRLVHRIASLNAFIGCNRPDQPHQGRFLICRHCRNAIELESRAIGEAIAAAANSVGFTVEGETVEVVGLCMQCRSVA